MLQQFQNFEAFEANLIHMAPAPLLPGQRKVDVPRVPAPQYGPQQGARHHKHTPPRPPVVFNNCLAMDQAN